MIDLLRVVRGVVGIAFGLKVLGLFSDIIAFVGWLQNNPSYPNPLSSSSLDLVILLIAGAMFDGLRTLINRIHAKRSGSTVLVLPQRWSL